MRFTSGKLSKVHLPKGLRILPDKLKLFHWHGYPSKSLPTIFNAENLVELGISDSNFENFGIVYGYVEIILSFLLI